MLYWITANTLVACGIAVLALLATRFLKRRPAAGHLLWMCVLVALIAPPLPKLSILDGRAHAQRLATHVGTNWIPLRTAGGQADPTDPHDDLHPDQASHAEKCQTCKRLAQRLATPDTGGDSATPAGAVSPGYATPRPLERAAHEAAKLAKNDHGKPDEGAPQRASDKPAQAGWGQTDEDRAAPAPVAPGWQPRPEPFDWAALATGAALAVWLAGSLIALGRLLRAWQNLRALIAEATPAGDALAAEVAAAARELGVRPPRLRVASCVRTPFIAGWWRPTLVWPRDESLDAPGARAVLAHELAHLARRDHWWAWFQAVAMCILWWHPLAHLARLQAAALAERACDAWVIWAYPDARRDYADALVAAVERLTRLPRPVPALAAVDADKKTLARRLVMIMQGNIARRGSTLLAIGAITLTAALAPSWATATLEHSPYSLVRGDIDRSLRPLVDAAKLERLAGTHASAKEYDQAIAAYTKLIELRPDDAGAYHELAMAQYYTGQYVAAAETFGRGAEVAAKQDKSWWQAGGVNVYQAQEAAKAAKEAQAVAMEKAAHAQKEAKKLAELAKRDAAETSAVEAATHADHIKQRYAEARDKLEAAKAQLADAGLDADLDDELADLAADLEAELADAYADAEDHYAELAEFAADEAWEEFEDSFDEMDGFDFGGVTPVSDWVYNQACCLALAGDEKAAAQALARAVEYGYDDAEHASDDSDLESIHGSEAFAKIATRMTGLAEAAAAGEQAFAEERWDDALEAFEAAAELAPKNGHYHHMMAFAALRTGDTDLAYKGWSAALGMNYNQPTMLYNLACVTAVAGKTDAAIGYLQKAVDAGFEDYKFIKEDPDLEAVRGDSRFDSIVGGIVATAKLQREVETAAEFEEWSTVADKARALQARAADDSWRQAWAAEKAAMGLFYSGRYDEAEDAFAEAAEHHGDLDRNLYNIACCRAQSGDGDGALDYLHAAVDVGWDDAEHLQHDSDLEPLHGHPGFAKVVGRAADNQILDQFNVANWEQLHDRSTRQIKENAEDGGAHLRLGWSLIRTGRAEAAVPVFERQAELGFAPAIAVYNIACCYAILGDKDRAFDALEQAIDNGFDEVEFMAEDPDLSNLRSDPRFKRMLAEHKSAKADAESETRTADR